jgi:AraC-like DNA-binding protein
MLSKPGDEKSEDSSHPLKTNKVISNYLELLLESLNDGLSCDYFHKIKQKELFYYLRAYYPKKELSAFFSPMLNGDIHFSQLVFKNYDSVKNLGELAKIANYSLSGFKKRFTKVFGMSPQRWIENEKAKKIRYEINCTHKSFKEISVEFNFSSPSHFDSFCKRVFGMSPGKLRENAKYNATVNS